jgi:hypothetical protein
LVCKSTRTSVAAARFSGNNICNYEEQEDIFSMELRLLTTDTERQVFLTRVERARAEHGGSFRENSQSQSINRQRLDCSRLYGLFQNETAPAEEMVAGVAMHDLRSFPQSCREPDLSHLPPETVAECSDHWSLSNGAGMLAWAGLAVPMRLLGIQAILAYLAAGETACAHAGFYELMGFVSAGPLVAHPFVEDAQGEQVLVQPVMLEGEAFKNAMQALSLACIEYSDDARVFHLKNFIRPLVRLASARSAAGVATRVNNSSQSSERDGRLIPAINVNQH